MALLVSLVKLLDPGVFCSVEATSLQIPAILSGPVPRAHM